MLVFLNYYTPAWVEWSELMRIINNAAERRGGSLAVLLCVLSAFAYDCKRFFLQPRFGVEKGGPAWSQVERTLFHN